MYEATKAHNEQNVAPWEKWEIGPDGKPTGKIVPKFRGKSTGKTSKTKAEMKEGFEPKTRRYYNPWTKRAHQSNWFGSKINK